VIGVIGILSAFSEALSCLLAPAMIIAVLLMVVAWFIAAKEALDLDWGQTIVTVILGWLALIAIRVVAALILGLLGLGAAAVGGAIGL
jgi:hypothetical protein